jgi:flavorubredoxin
MSSIKILENIYWIGVNDKRNILFEGLWPIPHGISYNSYIIKSSEKIALIDTVDKYYEKEFISNIKEIVNPQKIEYLILNHLEPDHSGSFEEILRMSPKIKVVGSQLAINIAKKYYKKDFESIIIKDNDTISLGDKTLKFIEAPWLHWPETIFTYIIEDQVLFSGDAFGGFGALNKGIFDEEIDMSFYEKEMKRYFANIVSHYSNFVIKAKEKINNLPIKILCPAHGPIYKKNVEYPISRYLQWCLKDEDKVLIIYGSMYGHINEIVEYLERKLKEKKVKVISYNLSYTHPSYILTDLIDCKIFLLGSPVYEASIFPLMANMIELIKIKHIRPKAFGLFINFTWGESKVSEKIKKELQEIGMNFIEPCLLTKGKITEEDKKSTNILIENIIEKLQSL